MACTRNSFLFMAENYSIVSRPHFVYSFICWWTLGYFHLLAVVKNVTFTIGIWVNPWVSAFDSLGYMPRRRIARLYDSSMLNFLRNCQTFQWWLCRFTFLPAKHKGSNFSTSLPTHVIFFSFFICFFLIFFVLSEVLKSIRSCTYGMVD